MKNKLFIALGIIALFLSNKTFASEPAMVNCELIKKDNQSLTTIVEITLQKRGSTIEQKINCTEKLTQQKNKYGGGADAGREVIKSLQKDLEYFESSAIEIKALREKVVSNDLLARSEKENFEKNKKEMPGKIRRKVRRTLNRVLSINEKMILALDEFSDKLAGAIAAANERVDVAQKEVNKLSAHK